MFCPKCGTQNPETGRFCRSCGADLGNVSAALSGNLPVQFSGKKIFGEKDVKQHRELSRRQDPNELFGDSIKQILTGVGFLIVAIALLTTGVAGGRNWWWAMLFPAFGCLGKGVSDYLKSKRIERQQAGFSGQSQNSLNQSFGNTALPPPSAKLDEIQSLLNVGNKIMAIKVYRETYGAGLKEAKDAVEQIERRRQMPPVSFPNNHNDPLRGSIYDTGELTAPLSVVENTTRHLEINSEGETMTLPPPKK